MSASAATRRRSPGCDRALDDIRRVAAPILAQKLIDDPDPIVEEPVAGEDGAAGGAADGPLAPEPVSVADAAARVATAARFLRKQDPHQPRAVPDAARPSLGRAARDRAGRSAEAARGTADGGALPSQSAHARRQVVRSPRAMRDGDGHAERAGVARPPAIRR